MNNVGIKKAIAGLEAEIKNLKAQIGLRDDEDSEMDDSESPIEPVKKEVGRGRKKRTVPSLGNMDDEMGEGDNG